MNQMLEQEEIYILIPEIQEKAEKVKEKTKKIRKKIKVLNHFKYHQERKNINKVKNIIDSSMLGVNYYNR
jgi:hypothetical protein